MDLRFSSKPVRVHDDGLGHNDLDASLEFVSRNSFIMPIIWRKTLLRRAHSEPALLALRPTDNVSAHKSLACDSSSSGSSPKVWELPRVPSNSAGGKALASAEAQIARFGKVLASAKTQIANVATSPHATSSTDDDDTPSSMAASQKGKVICPDTSSSLLTTDTLVGKEWRIDDRRRCISAVGKDLASPGLLDLGVSHCQSVWISTAQPCVYFDSNVQHVATQSVYIAQLRAQAQVAENAAQLARHAAQLWAQAREAEDAAQLARQAARLWAEARSGKAEGEHVVGNDLLCGGPLDANTSGPESETSKAQHDTQDNTEHGTDPKHILEVLASVTTESTIIGEAWPGKIHTFHYTCKRIGTLSEDMRQVTKTASYGFPAHYSEAHISKHGRQRYLLRFSGRVGATLSKYDGVGFMFSRSVPGARDNERTGSLFLKQSGQICACINSDIVKLSVSLKPLEIGDIIGMTVDFEKRQASFTIWPISGAKSSQAEFDFSVSSASSSIEIFEEHAVGHFYCASTNTGVTVQLLS